MPSRRALLAAVGALAGCPERRLTTPTPTATPAPTTTETPVPPAVAEALGASRFEGDPPCPGAVPCYHRISKGASPETVVIPDRERLTPEAPETTTTAYNLGEEPLVLGTPARVFKWTGLLWAPTHGVDVPNDVRVLDPGETLERTVDVEGRGDGRYAIVEYGYFGSPRDPATVRPDAAKPRRLAGEFFRFGAQFEVRGSEWSLAREPVPTERDGETLLVRPDRDGDRTLVLETSDQSEGVPLVPETVAAHPPTRDAVLALGEDGVERVRMPTSGAAMWYVEHAMIYLVELGADRTLRLDDLLFTARVE